MPIPDYQAFMAPLMQTVRDGRTHRISELYEVLADHFALTEKERAELLPSGRQRVYQNRIGWAKTFLVKAGLLEQPKRAFVKITSIGLEVLESGETIDTAFLERFPQFREFRNRSGNSRLQIDEKNGTQEDTSGNVQKTPQEEFEAIYRELRSTLAEELLEVVQTASPTFFEQLVVELLVSMGYGGSVRDAGQAMGRSGDNGIDGIIKQDRLAIDNIYVQAKRWTGAVGSPEVRNFAGSLAYFKAVRGVFITTGSYTAGAIDTAKQLGNIVLVDGERLAQLMIEYDVGVSAVATFELKRVDYDYFEGES